jgi:hypothetical protein
MSAINKEAATSGLPSYGMLECRVILLNSENMLLADKLQDALDKIARLEQALMEASEIGVSRHGKSPSKKPARR